VAGIKFTITGDNYEKTVTTGSDGTISVEGMFPGTYTVTEASYDRYEPQSSQKVTIVGGKTTTVTFINKLKRGDLQVTKTSEDGLAEGMKFHLYGTSLSGLKVDEYAVTDSKGIAKFENVLIGTGYVLEEVDTPIRYVIPSSQTASIEWNKVTNKSFHNILKKFRVTVTKSDVETGTPQGDASLAGATYGIYNGGELVDTYTTDTDGKFTTKYYICGDNWTIKEIQPSEGYLLDGTTHKVGAEAKLYTVEYNSTSNDVTEHINCQVKVLTSDHIIMDTLFTRLDMIFNAIGFTRYGYNCSMVKNTIKDCIRYYRITEDRLPITKVDVCGDNCAFLFIPHINQLEE